MTWSQQIEAYLAEHEGLTRQRYAAALADFQQWYRRTYRELPDAGLVTREELREYRAYLTHTRALRATTVNTHLAPLRGLLRHQGRTVKIKSVQLVRPAIEALTGRELGRLLAAVAGERWQDQRNTALLTLLAKTGLRVSEALALSIEDLDLNSRSGTCTVLGKGLKARRVPLAKEVRETLTTYLAVRPATEHRILFISRSYGALSARDVQRLIRRAAAHAGIEKRVTPHVLRHTFATRFLRRNAGDLATLARLLGHSNVATTTRYLHPTTAQVQAMVEEL